MIIGPIAFSTPWLLLALIALPLLWILLRAIPPAPIRRFFPGVALLLGLQDDDSVSDRTPWWLLLLRMLAVAAVITGLAGPVLNPSKENLAGSDPILIVMDASWASARDWDDRLQMLDRMLSEATRDGRPVALVRLTAPETPLFQSASTLRTGLPGLVPNAWLPTPDMLLDFGKMLDPELRFETRWFSDGLEHEGTNDVLTALQAHGSVSVFLGRPGLVALEPAGFLDGAVTVRARRPDNGFPRDIVVHARGSDPSGADRILAERKLGFEAAEIETTGQLDLPAEIRGRITQFEIKGVLGAGAVSLTDDSLRRREVALFERRENREGLELLSPLHYLRQALEPTADLLKGAIFDILPANPDVIVLADVPSLAADEETALSEWVAAGGLLLRFAGPRLAASEVSRREEHPLMPVRLRAGGRSVGGAMSWGEPKALAPFSKDSPFFGLDIPNDVAVNAQVVAQPDPTLSERAIAQLTDGTPLVTRKYLGQGQIVLFHVTANAEWSTLPLSGLFVEMLARLSVSSAKTNGTSEELTGTIWQPINVLDGFGRLHDGNSLPGVRGDDLVKTALGPTLLPGVYVSGDRTRVRNALEESVALTPASWPPSVAVQGFSQSLEVPLGGWLLAFALLLLLIDILAALALTGRLRNAVAIICVLTLPIIPREAVADDTTVINAAAEITLAHVLTGDRALDDTAQAGLLGLSETLFFRTSVEPGTPVGIDLEKDELSVHPLIYWPIAPDQKRPSAAAYERLNHYLRTGGMILFDTRDADIVGFGASSPNGRKLQQLAAPLDIPALQPVPEDHVLTRTFYLLQDFPGRHSNHDVWVEAAAPDAEKIEGMPFRNLNDGVTPVVIGGNDWASAWAVDARGNPIFPIGRGLVGERQRELAYRFGVNLVMYVLTGNYKSDQVHVPALLERLGQ